jgi:hypothetical protein
VKLLVEFLNLVQWLTQPKARSSGFDLVTGSPRSISIFFKKSKEYHFSKKKKKVNGLQSGFLPGLAGSRVTLDFDFLYFFSNPAWF